MLQEFKGYHHGLKHKGFVARLVELDNQISNDMIQLFEQHNNSDDQLAAPGDHRLMPGEHAIQTFYNYFVAVRR